MTFPVLVELNEGRFQASLVGSSNIFAIEESRSQAISSLEAKIHQRIESGDLLFLNIDNIGISSIAGKYKSDPTLRDICDNAYAQRDEDCNQ